MQSQTTTKSNLKLGQLSKEHSNEWKYQGVFILHGTRQR